MSGRRRSPPRARPTNARSAERSTASSGASAGAAGVCSSWHVEREGRGIDLAVEVLFHGDQKKDLRANVERYARLGIPEYFVFDGKRSRISAWRLSPGQARYAPIVPQYGAYPSQVLGVEFPVVEGRLRLFQDGLEVASAEDEIGRLVRLVNERERTLAAEAERAAAESERAAA